MPKDLSGNQPLDALRAELGEAVRAHQTATDAVDEAAAVHLGVNRTDLRCVDLLLQEGPTAPGRLAAALGLTTGSVTTMLDRLEKLGYLTRSPDPDDRRKVVVQVTQEAADRAMRLYGPLAEEGARAVAPYDEAALRLLIGFFTRSRDVQDRHAARISALTSAASPATHRAGRRRPGPRQIVAPDS